jgi:hypothetical protein
MPRVSPRALYTTWINMSEWKLPVESTLRTSPVGIGVRNIAYSLLGLNQRLTRMNAALPIRLTILMLRPRGP